MKIRMSDDNNSASLTSWRGTAVVYLRDATFGYWAFSQHGGLDDYCGRWTNWRLQRARRRAIAASHWTALPRASVVESHTMTRAAWADGGEERRR